MSQAGELTDDRIGHLLSNESDLSHYIENEAVETSVKELMSIASKQNNKRAMKIILDFIVQQLTARLRGKYVQIWAGEEVNENDQTNTVLVCFYSGPCDKSMETFYDLKVIHREHDAIDNESASARSYECHTDIGLMDKNYEIVNRLIAIHGKNLFVEHSNLEAISSSSILSSKSRGLVQETCIVLYCRLKGIIPFGGALFPRKLETTDKESIAVDVRQGFFSDRFTKQSNKNT